MADSPVFPVEELRVRCQKAVHNNRKGCFFYSHEQMEMIGHETVSVEFKRLSSLNIENVIEEGLKIVLIQKDVLFIVAAGNHVCQGTGVMEARLAGHDERIL